MSDTLITIKEAAERLGTQRNRVSAAIQVLGIETHRAKLNGSAKLIDVSAVELLREKFTQRPASKATA